MTKELRDPKDRSGTFFVGVLRLGTSAVERLRHRGRDLMATWAQGHEVKWSLEVIELAARFQRITSLTRHRGDTEMDEFQN